MASSPVTTLGDQQMDGSPQLRKSCDYCVRMKRGCDGGTPCELCTRRNKECLRSVKKRSGPAKGTKYCKRKPRKNPNAASSSPLSSSSKSSKSPSSTSTSGAGGASAAATANTLSGGPSVGHSPLPPRGGKNGMIKARPSPSKKTKREAATAAAAGGGAPLAPGAAAAAPAGLLPPLKHEGAPPAVGAAVGIDPPLQQQQQQHVRWRGQEYGGADTDRGKTQPDLGGGGIGSHRRGSSGTVESYSSRRSSLGSIAGFGLDGDRRYSLEADACSGSLLPFYFAPPESDGAGGGGSGDAPWVGGDLRGGGVGGGRVVAEDGSGGGGIAEAEQAAMMMAARRSSLEEALYGTCYKRTSFSNAWGQPPSSSTQHQYPHPHHRHMSSADGLAWNQLLQQADTANHEQGQGQGANNSGPGGGGGGASGSGDPAGGRMSTSHPSAFHSPAIGGSRAGADLASQHQELQHQQNSTSMPPPTSVLSSFEAHHAGGGGGGDGSSGSSTMPSLRDLLFDTGNSARWPPPLAPPPLNEMSMVESSS